MSNLGNKETMARNILKYMEEQGLSRMDMCDALHVPYTTFRDWVKAASYPRIDKIEKMAHFFGVSKADLVEEDHVPEKSIQMDVIGNIAAGFDGVVNMEKTGDSFAVPLEWLRGHKTSDFIILKVRGASMTPLILDGDFCLIQKQATMDYPGQIGAVIFDDDSVTLKKVNYKFGEDWMELIPLNRSEFSVEKIEGELLEHCRVVGVLRRLIRVF